MHPKFPIRLQLEIQESTRFGHLSIEAVVCSLDKGEAAVLGELRYIESANAPGLSASSETFSIWRYHPGADQVIEQLASSLV